MSAEVVHDLAPTDAEPSRYDLAAEGAMTIPAAAEWSGLSRRRLYQLIAEGRVQATRVGRRRLIFRASLRRLLAEED